MSKIVISFEKDIIKVVYATARKGNLVVQKALSFRDDEFDGFLLREKAKRFTVVYNFKAFYSDVFYIPSVKKRGYFKRLLESEIRKRFPELKAISFLYTTFGDVLYEGKSKSEVFVFAVSNEEIEEVTNRFTRYGKQITHLIPNIFSLAQIVQPAGEPVLCISKSGMDVALFLLKDEKPYFIRVIQGMEGDSLVENINMTINYCHQSLNIEPSRVILIGNGALEYTAKGEPLCPLTHINYPSQISASKETIVESISAVACLWGEMQSRRFLRENNCLPAEYKNLYTTMTALSSLTILFLLLSLPGLWYITSEIFAIGTARERIESIRNEIKGLEQIGSKYTVSREKLERFIPIINITNSINLTPDIQKVLLLLPGISVKNLRIDNISIKVEGDAIKLRMAGVVSTQSLALMQISYQNLVDSLKGIKGMEVLSHTLTIEDKAFVIEAKYRDEGKGNK